MNSLPNTLPCFRATEEYSPIGEMRQMYGYYRQVYIPRTTEQQAAYQADLEKRMARLNARLDEIFASPSGLAYLKMYQK